MANVPPQQEGVATIRAMDYFDIMLIGETGQGKSTTADKLLIANPTEENYVKKNMRLYNDENLQDLQMWWLPDDPDAQKRITTRLTNLVEYRASVDSYPHVSINRAHAQYTDKSQPGMTASKRTLKCELFSNETTKYFH